MVYSYDLTDGITVEISMNRFTVYVSVDIFNFDGFIDKIEIIKESFMDERFSSM